MLTLVVTLCVAGQPAACHVARYFPPPGVSLRGCSIVGLNAVAHDIPDGYVVREWHCEIPKQGGAA